MDQEEDLLWNNQMDLYTFQAVLHFVFFFFLFLDMDSSIRCKLAKTKDHWLFLGVLLYEWMADSFYF